MIKQDFICRLHTALAENNIKMNKMQTKAVYEILCDTMAHILQGGEFVRLSGIGTLKINEFKRKEINSEKIKRTLRIKCTTSSHMRALLNSKIEHDTL